MLGWAPMPHGAVTGQSWSATAARILILEAQVPFIQGGAEILVRQLHRALVARGHLVDVVSVPFQHTPKGELWASVEA